MTGGIVAVVPYDNGADGLDITLKSGGGPPHRVDGKIWRDVAGMVYAKVQDPGFVVFAIKQQGYAQDAFDVSGVVELPEGVDS